MRAEQLIKCFEPLQQLKARLGPLNRFKIPVTYITDRSKALLLTWFSMLLVLVSVSVTILFLSSMCLDDF